MAGVKLITAPIDVVTLDEAKSYYRIIGTDAAQDADIMRSIRAATAKAEQITNRQLCAATYELYLDQFQTTVKLPKPPFIEVVKVEYKKTDGTIATTTDFSIDDVKIPAELSFTATLEDLKTTGANNIVITFNCGYDVVPDAIVQYILINGLTMFENRENIVLGTIVDGSIKNYTDRLLDDYRIVPI